MARRLVCSRCLRARPSCKRPKRGWGGEEEDGEKGGKGQKGQKGEEGLNRRNLEPLHCPMFYRLSVKLERPTRHNVKGRVRLQCVG